MSRLVNCNSVLKCFFCGILFIMSFVLLSAERADSGQEVDKFRQALSDYYWYTLGGMHRSVYTNVTDSKLSHLANFSLKECVKKLLSGEIVFKDSEMSSGGLSREFYTFCGLVRVLKLKKKYSKIHNTCGIKDCPHVGYSEGSDSGRASGSFGRGPSGILGEKSKYMMEIIALTDSYKNLRNMMENMQYVEKKGKGNEVQRDVSADDQEAEELEGPSETSIAQLLVRYPEDSLLKGLVFYAGLENDVAQTASRHLLNAVGDVSYDTLGGYPCAQFDGSSLLSFGENNLISLNQPCTMSIWVYPEESGRNVETIFCIGRNSPKSKRSIVRNDGDISFEGGYVCTFSTFKLKPQKWQSCIATYNERSLKLYVNGKLVSSGSFRLNTKKDFIVIGGILKDDKVVDGWNGGLREARIYDRVLSSEEIQRLSRNMRSFRK